MKKWYCPHCKTFKRFPKVHSDYCMDYYHCRCCGEELINAKQVVERFKEDLVRKYAEERE